MEYIDIFSRKLLRFAPYNPQGFFRDKRITPMNEVPRDELGYGNSVFLHGALMSRNDHDDRCFCLNCKTMGLTRATYRNGSVYEKLYANGVFPVSVEGIGEECVGYFWTFDERKIVDIDGNEWPEWNQCGLICLTDDKVGQRSAIDAIERKYDTYYEPRLWPFY